ncbi:MAG: PAS domain S-box protein [Acidobacteria bacterium]|nr:PAS domain S-box protein [Acidobacteriota bacterium]MBI3489914.1 PAS domain S-box protein [Acidobacteriota bacterium]
MILHTSDSATSAATPGRRPSLLPYAAAILVAALLVVPSFWAFLQMKEAGRSRRHTYETLLAAEAMQSAMSRAETSQRGYLITGDEAFLKPYEADRAQSKGQLGVLRQQEMGAEAREHLVAVAPLIEAKWMEMSDVLALRRKGRLAAAQAVVRKGEGRRLMEAIHVEMGAFTRAEALALTQNEASSRMLMNRLFIIMALVSIFVLLAAISLVDAFRRRARRRMKEAIHLETSHLLETQEETNRRMMEAHATLQESEEKLAVTLNSIGDAVIATDAEARIKLMNPVAERLTGWALGDALGRHVDEVFQIINQETRHPAVAPVMDTLAHGTIQGLANHTLLIARNGTECAIADSCAPIRNRDARVAGAVLVFRDVTKEYAAQQSLRDSTALIQAILNTVVDGVITIQAQGGLIETVNPAVERMFGYSVAELVGQRISLLIPRLAHVPIETALEPYTEGQGNDSEGPGREIEGMRKNGEAFPLELAASDMWLGGQRYFTGILRDITARKRVEAALLEAGALQAAIFSSANFSSIATDAQGVIQIFNVGAERMFGYAAEDVVNKITPADISDPKEVIERAEALSLELDTPIAPGFEALAFKASRGIGDIYELTYIRKNGSRFPAVVSVTALRDQHDTIIGYLLIGTDNTARKQVEVEWERLDQALQDRNAELVCARIIADKANLAKSEFLSSMSHELRSPLNAILGFAQLLDSTTPPATPAQKGSIDRILHAGWYLLELINEILDLAVIESGKLSLSEEPVSLSEVLFDCQSMVEPQGLKRGIQLTFPTFEAPFFVCADRIRLKQVLINLLSNATKYNRPGGTVHVACLPAGPGRVRISVQDTGQGMRPEQLRQLFQPFNRLGQEHSPEEGTGIGLVMSKLLVELMGGTLGVESEPGVGSLFWYDLNTTTSPTLVEPDPGGSMDELAQSAGSGPLHTILCVEDNPANLDLIQQLIARRPELLLLCAGTAAQGLELAASRLPEVILMDINLPGMNGVEALFELRKSPGTAHIPVIAISANAMVGDIKRGLESGFSRYLTKPINVVEFMGALDEALRLAKTGRVHADSEGSLP